jgi:hypothetical protein
MRIQFDPNQPIYSEAFERARPELEAMSPSDVEPIRHDIVSAIFLVVGRTMYIRELVELVRARFGEEAARKIASVEMAAHACGKAHALHLTTLNGIDVEEMHGRLTQTKSVLLFEVQRLISAKKLPASMIGELVGGNSYRGLCIDVLQLTSGVRHAWSDVKDHTGLTELELAQAEALANAFSTVVSENEAGTATSPTADMRRRAYTLFVRTYSEVRRYMTYFRWEAGDADERTPPLGAGRQSRSGASTDDELPVVPSPVDGAPEGGPTTPNNG